MSLACELNAQLLDVVVKAVDIRSFIHRAGNPTFTPEDREEAFQASCKRMRELDYEVEMLRGWLRDSETEILK